MKDHPLVKGWTPWFASSPGGKLYACTRTGDDAILLLDPTDGHLVRSLAARSYSTCGAAFSPDGRDLASIDREGPIRVWDVATGEERRRWSLPHGRPTWIGYSPDGKFLVTNHGGAVRLWDPARGREGLVRESLPGVGPPTEGEGLAFSPDGKALVLLAREGFFLYELASGETLRTFPGAQPCSVAFSPDGERLAAGFPSGEIRVWALD